MRSPTVRLERVEFSGHNVSYCVLGNGPPLVIIKPHRGARVYAFAQQLAARFTVIQVDPLGYGWSDRPPDQPPDVLHEQVQLVADREDIDRFPVWGYSMGGVMALAVTRSSPRVTAMICGGWSPAERLSETWLRRMDRDARMPIGQRAFWHWHSRFDWLTELSLIDVPRLVYVGTEDGARMRGPRGIPRVRADLENRGVEVHELDGLDHITCMTEPAFSTRVEPMVVEWLDKPTAEGTRPWKRQRSAITGRARGQTSRSPDARRSCSGRCDVVLRSPVA